MSSPTPGTTPAPSSSPVNNSTSPPPVTPSAPPPATPAPPPATPSAPPPTTPSPPPPVVTPAAPPPTTPSPPPPVTPAAPPPSTPSPPPPVTPDAPPPATPSPPDASPPPPSTTPTPTTPASSPPPPSMPSTSPPPPSSSGSSPPPPSSLRSPPPPSNSTSPPTPIARSPPPPSSSTPSSPPVTQSPPSPPPPTSLVPAASSSSTTNVGLIAGIAVAGVVVVAALILLFICCKKKRKRRGEEDFYVAPPPPGSKDNQSGGPPHYWHQNAPPPSRNVVTMPPKPSPPPHSLGKNPPPPLFMNSSGGSGSNYSGPENPLTPPSPGIALGFSKSTFTYEELAMATDGFSNANLLGQGGFGYVHKGVLPNGKEIAVKQLKVGSGQGEREFQAEVEIISRVHHKHLVSLVGYCTTGSQRMLVYEFVPNNTMEFHLHGKGRPIMDWTTRLRIALGSAKGLAYLHEDCHPKIIHRDIKAANILIDFSYEAKVADFGLAKISSDLNTHVSTRVMGTFGYLAPEYASSGKLSEKSDVYSFGVMLLELITGRRPVDTTNSYVEDSLVDWARPLLTRALEEDNFDALVDPKLQKDYNHNEMSRMVACAAASVRHSARRRPRMSQIVRALEGDVSLSVLNEGVKPGHSSVYSSYESSDYDTSQYNEDLKKFRRMALQSQEYGSSEYSEPTSEYGFNASESSSEALTRQTTREMDIEKMKKDSRGFSGNY